MITVDTSAVVALWDSSEDRHAATVTLLDRERIALLPWATLGEIAYFIEYRHNRRTLSAFIRHLIDGAFELDTGSGDLPRVLELVERYEDLPLGFVDAAVIACAERNGGRVLTYDYRHFGVVAGEGTITLVQ